MSVNGELEVSSSQRDEVLLDGVLDNLEQIGYIGPLLEEKELISIIQDGLSSASYTDLCMQLCTSLQHLCPLQSKVNRPQGEDDSESFQLEVRSLLRELSCPHSCLMEGLDLLSDYHKRLLLLDFLLSEFLAAKLLSVRCEEEMEIGGEDGSIPASLSAILRAYDIKQPPPGTTIKRIFDRIIGTTREAVAKGPPDHISPSLVTQPLSPEQLETLDKINARLTNEYEVRRRMLLTRCDVTVQSFRWSENTKGKDEEFSEVCQSHKQLLTPSAPVGVARVLAAKRDLLIVEKTNSADVRSNTQCSVNKVVIGKVPDRGGRPRETRPPPEMPAFRARTTEPQDQRKGGGAHGRGKGKGRVQGSWNEKKGGGGKGGGWQGGGSHGYQHKGGGGGKQKQYYS